MAGRRATGGRDRDRAVESYESSTIPHREREKVDVGELLRTEDVAAVNKLGIGERQIVSPEFVICLTNG